MPGARSLTGERQSRRQDVDKNWIPQTLPYRPRPVQRGPLFHHAGLRTPRL